MTELMNSISIERPIRLGYVPLNDCAPIAVAQEMGLFAKYDLNVSLSRQPGWTSVLDMFYHGQLDAAQSIAGLALVLAMGFQQEKREVVVPLYLSAQGNAITLSRKISAEKIGNGKGLAAMLQQWNHTRPFTLAATHRYSSHHILLHQWLVRNGIQPSDPRVEIVFLPPPVMARTLRSGHIDGYCVGEPWNSDTILTGDGWCPAVSADISFGHPEKVFLLADDFLRQRHSESIRLCAALLEACKICQDPHMREELIDLLARPKYIGISKHILRHGLGETFDYGNGKNDGGNFQLFYGDEVNRPSTDKTSWLISGLRNAGVIREGTLGSLTKIFREDLYLEAQRMRQAAV